MRLFIDTNIYLDYFRASSESLASLKALKNLLTQKRVILVVPEQTEQEYLRRRSGIVEETRNELLKQRGSRAFNGQTPVVRGWKRAKTIEKIIRNLMSAYDDLLEEYDKKSLAEKTEADLLIKDIFKLSDKLAESKFIIEKANLRYMKGNPPRKYKDDRSLGDAIVWESLLEDANKDNLAIITHDTDFICKQKEEQVLNHFLRKEWEKKTNKKINLYISLAKFINYFEKKDVIKKEIVQEEEKRGQRAIIDSVSMSGVVNLEPLNFAQTVRANDFDLISRPFTAWQASEGLYNFTPANISAPLKFCPYCGKDIEESLRGYPSVQQYVLSARYQFACPSCGERFFPARL